MNAYCTKRTEPMRDQPHSWNLRRIFGRQFVGWGGRPSWPEARIAARAIPAQLSRRVFRGRVTPTGDLATCGLDSSHSSSVSTAFNSKVGDFAAQSFSAPLPTGNSEEP
jgi:hypothetical protein